MQRTISTLLIALILWLAATNIATAQTNDPPPYVEPGYRIITTTGDTSNGLSYLYAGTERVASFCLQVYECENYLQPEPASDHVNPFSPEDWIADAYDVAIFGDNSGRITDPSQDNITVTTFCMAWGVCDRPSAWPDTPRVYLPIAYNP